MPIFNPDTADPTVYNIYLDNLADVYAGAPLDGNIIQWSDASGAWLSVPYSSITGAPNSLDALTNVVITSTSAGQGLIYNGSVWVNSGLVLANITNVGTPDASGQALVWNGVSYVFGNPSGTSSVTSLDDLSNVVITSASEGQVILFTGGTFVNSVIPFTIISGVDARGNSVSQALIWNGSSWVPGRPTGSLAVLNDVQAASPTGLNVLAYSGGTWLNMPLRLEHLGNVLKSGEHGYPVDQDVLHYHGGYWQSGPQNLDNLTDVDTAGAVINKWLVYNGTYWAPQYISLSNLNNVTAASSGQGSILEISGSSWITSPSLNNLRQSYLTGIYDVTYHGVTNTGANVTQAIKTLLNAIPDGSTVRFPAGIYNITGTIFINRKHNLYIDATNAKFREPAGQIASGGTALGSGTFYFYYCTGITFMGGHMSGYGTHGAIMGLTSGLFFSGYDNSAFSYFAGDDQGDRNVVPCLFNMEQCSKMTLNNWTVTNKYRFAFTYRCIDTEFHNNYFHGVLTGDLQRQSKELVQGPTGNFVYLGELHKICARQNYCLTIIKGRNVEISNFDTYGCGGLITCGSSSLGGGQGPAIPELVNIDNCYMYNSYDNHIYFSSANICTAKNCRGINDPAYSYAIGGIKGRGADIVFENCYVQHSYHGFGIEGLGGTNQDYWTNGTTPGWSSKGCKVINCTAVDIDAHGVFLDTNEDNDCFPRDVLISNCYFYNCGLSVYNRNPTGWQDGDGPETSVIQGCDTYRLRIIGNTIENTGAVGPNQAIYLGQQRLPAETWVTGCEVSNNTFLGCKQGIYLNYISNAKICDNYGERIGTYKAPYIEYSGYPALVVCNNVKDSRIYDNILAPTGHAASIYVVPGSTFTNVRRRDNDGYEVIN